MARFKSKKLLIVISTVLVVAGVAFAYTQILKQPQDAVSTAPDGTSYPPPTQEEKEAGDKQKQESSKINEPIKQNDTSQKNGATVIITDAAQYDDIIEVRAFIPDYYQDGTCTISFTKAELSVTKSTPAYADSSNTICTNPEIKRSEFPSSGNWQVSVTYESEGAKGTSDQQTITIK